MSIGTTSRFVNKVKKVQYKEKLFEEINNLYIFAVDVKGINFLRSMPMVSLYDIWYIYLLPYFYQVTYWQYEHFLYFLRVESEKGLRASLLIYT